MVLSTCDRLTARSSGQFQPGHACHVAIRDRPGEVIRFAARIQGDSVRPRTARAAHVDTGTCTDKCPVSGSLQRPRVAKPSRDCLTPAAGRNRNPGAGAWGSSLRHSGRVPAASGEWPPGAIAISTSAPAARCIASTARLNTRACSTTPQSSWIAVSTPSSRNRYPAVRARPRSAKPKAIQHRPCTRSSTAISVPRIHRPDQGSMP